MIGSIITSIPGSSAYFLGGVITYSNDSKEKLLKVKKSTMIEHGAVSENTAVEMAAGAKDLFGSDISVSTTGIAGPGGGSAAKPVGLVWIGVSTKNGTFARKFNFDGSRNDVQIKATDAAVRMLIDALAELD